MVIDGTLGGCARLLEAAAAAVILSKNENKCRDQVGIQLLLFHNDQRSPRYNDQRRIELRRHQVSDGYRNI